MLYVGLLCGITLFLYMTSLFIIGVIKQDNSVADSGWGMGFILVTLTAMNATNLYLARHLLVAALICIWGLRLSAHILQRNWSKGEDPRYKQWRQSWGKWVAVRSFFQIYMLQGVLLMIIAYPAIRVMTTTAPGLTIFDLLGTMVWACGFFFEVVGDSQLDQFVKNPNNRNKVLQTGLWQYTRHPNYFGEAVIWWGIFCIVYAATGAISTIISPITITLLLRYVSGVPMLEKMFEGNQQYEQYKKTTPIFFPRFYNKS